MPRPQLTRTKPLGGNRGGNHLSFEAELEGVALTAALDHALPGPVAAKLAEESATDRRSSVSAQSGMRGAASSKGSESQSCRTVADLVRRSPAHARLLGQRVRELLADKSRIARECGFDGPNGESSGGGGDDAAAAVMAEGKTGGGSAEASGQSSDSGAAPGPAKVGGGRKTAEALKEIIKLVDHEARVHVDAGKLRDLVVREVAEPLVKELAPGDGAAKLADAQFPRLISVQDEKGSRSYMEDKFMVCEHLTELCFEDGDGCPPPTAFYAVYDGHSGRLAADYARHQLFVSVARDPAFATDLAAAVTSAYRLTDARFAAMASRDSMNDGTTCLSLCVRGDQLMIHWCGDSEALLSRGPLGFEPMGPPHTPAREDEKQRVQDAGGTVVWYGTWRVNGTLGVARSLGDVAHAGIVTADPDHRAFSATDVSFILLASDGLFDVLTHAEAVNITRAYQMGLHGGLPAEAAQALVGEAIRRKTKDNVTAIVVYMSSDGRANSKPPRPDRPRHPQVEGGGGDGDEAAVSSGSTALPLPFAEDYQEAKAKFDGTPAADPRVAALSSGGSS